MTLPPCCQVRRDEAVSTGMRRVLTVLIVAALGVCLPPAAALGQGGGVDEYTEQLPGAGGGKPTSGGGDDENSTGGGPLSPAAVDSLDELGSDGTAAAELAQTSGPGTAQSPGDSGGSDAAVPDETSGAVDVGNLAGDSGDGVGIALPIVLALILLAAVGFVIVRRTGRRPGAA